MSEKDRGFDLRDIGREMRREFDRIRADYQRAFGQNEVGQDADATEAVGGPSDGALVHDLPHGVRERIARLKDLVERQNTLLTRFTTPPLLFAVVIDVRRREKDEDSTAVILFNGRPIEVLLPTVVKAELVPGDVVKVSPRTYQIVDVVEPMTIGSVATVKRVIDPRLVEVRSGSNESVVLSGRFGEKIEQGSRVVLDSSNSIVVCNLGMGDESFLFSGETNISWDDIGGLDEPKQQLREALELPYQHPDLFAYYSYKVPSGFLIFGPPGCGKTLLSKAIVTSIRNTHDAASTSTAFIYVKGPEVLSKFVGVAEELIRQLFDMGRAHKRKHGYPAVLCIDECEALLNARGSGRSSDVDRTIVPTFLAEMDGLDDKSVIVVLLTNRPDMLDEAVVRDGRVDVKVEIPRPTKEDASNIFRIHSAGVPLHKVTQDEIIAFAVEELFSDKHALYEIQRKSGTPTQFTLGHMASGAMIKGVVERSKSLALQRDRKAGSKTGVTAEDVRIAVKEKLIENIHLAPVGSVIKFTEDFQEDVLKIKTLKQVRA